MNNTSLVVETTITSIAGSLKNVRDESGELYKSYFATGSNTLVDGLSTGGTAATVSSKLTKTEFVNGISMLEQLNNFFGNAAVTQADYVASAINLTNGTTAAGAALSSDVENIGDRLRQMGRDLIEIKKMCDSTLKVYSASELSPAVAALSSTTVVFGCSSTKSKMGSGITLLEQFVKLMTNLAVTTGDYSSTVSQWS